jgi:hypothetical protein
MFLALTLALEVVKPTGLFLSAPDEIAIKHPAAKGCLIRVMWSDIEPVEGKFTFDPIRQQLKLLGDSEKGWSLGVIAGQHAPSWLVAKPEIPKLSFNFRGTTKVNIPVQWNSEVQTQLGLLAKALAKEFGDDPQLKLVYVPQMTANGIEGHFNGCSDAILDLAGYSEDKWVEGIEKTATDFALAFKNKALAVEVHEVKHSATPAKRIMYDLWKSEKLGERVGVAIWWLSGRTSYQGDLLKVIEKFPGDKYAQVIGRSSDASKFENSDYKTIFSQAKQLGIRYIEPWQIEFRSSKWDKEFLEFNSWSESQFGLVERR